MSVTKSHSVQVKIELHGLRAFSAAPAGNKRARSAAVRANRADGRRTRRGTTKRTIYKSLRPRAARGPGRSFVWVSISVGARVFRCGCSPPMGICCRRNAERPIAFTGQSRHCRAWHRPGRKYPIKGFQYFYFKKLSIHVITRISTCENALDLVDLQNTLDWS